MPGWTEFWMHRAWTPFLRRHGIDNGLPLLTHEHLKGGYTFATK
jgi:hypothetical protein